MKHPYLQTGKIVSTHGVHGEVKLLPWADGPEFLLQFHTLYLDGKAYQGRAVARAEDLRAAEAGRRRHRRGRERAAR